VVSRAGQPPEQVVWATVATLVLTALEAASVGRTPGFDTRCQGQKRVPPEAQQIRCTVALGAHGHTAASLWDGHIWRWQHKPAVPIHQHTIVGQLFQCWCRCVV
jgi:hypothetical protein